MEVIVEKSNSDLINIDLVKTLSDEFTVRCQRNPRYSLRAFAKSLGLSHTILSLVFSGKRTLSKKSMLKIADVLGLDPATIVDARKVKAKSKKYDDLYEYISLEDFQLISNWVHYAILSLLQLKTDHPDDVANPKWIADKLKIDETLAQICFKRLVDIGLIKKDEDGLWRQTGKPIKVENGMTTQFTRDFHKDLLLKAIDSLQNDPIHVRDFSSMTLAIDSKHIPYAQERIRHFRRELTAELEAKGAPTAVYNLTVQIYPVSKD